MNTPLSLQMNAECTDETAIARLGNSIVLSSPPVGSDYWLFRVQLSDTQAIIGFPKFFTIGIGFQREEDWNTNLPYSLPAEKIFQHIAHNKGDETIPDERCIEAIRLVQAAAAKCRSARLDQALAKRGEGT